MGTEYYTPGEVATMLKVKKYTVYHWIKRGKLHSVKINEKMLRIPADAIRNFIKEV